MHSNFVVIFIRLKEQFLINQILSCCMAKCSLKKRQKNKFLTSRKKCAYTHNLTGLYQHLNITGRIKHTFPVKHKNNHLTLIGPFLFRERTDNTVLFCCAKSGEHAGQPSIKNKCRKQLRLTCSLANIA